MLGFVATTSGSACAQAQVPAETRAQAMALARLCRADFDRLCPGVQPGGGRILACLNRHASELTPQCRDALKSKVSKIGAVHGLIASPKI
jgi:hypothetical protein